jgi:hypothetical protein
MNQVVIFTNKSGNVSICVPTGDLPVEAVQAKDIPSGVQSFIINESSLPASDQDFFDAWEQIQGVVSVSLAKAKEVTKKRLRIEREPLFAALDIAFQRAFETGADTSAIVAEKQRLRDLTKLPDSCSTLSELRSLKAG